MGEPEHEPTVLVVTSSRGRGRPRVSEPRTSVSTWLPATEHDRLIRLAKATDQSVSSLVKSLLMMRMPK